MNYEEALDIIRDSFIIAHIPKKVTFLKNLNDESYIRYIEILDMGVYADAYDILHHFGTNDTYDEEKIIKKYNKTQRFLTFDKDDNTADKMPYISLFNISDFIIHAQKCVSDNKVEGGDKFIASTQKGDVLSFINHFWRVWFLDSPSLCAIRSIVSL